MPLGIDLGSLLFIVPISGMAAIAVYAWWSSEPRETVLYSVFFCLSYFFIFISSSGVEIFGLPKQIVPIAIGLEFVFMIGAIYFMWKQHFDTDTTGDTA